MLLLRSLVFNVVFYLNLALFLIFGAPFFVTPRRWSIAALKLWARTSLWLLKAICGTRFEVRGRQHIPHGAALVAGKHQSFWETFALIPLFDDPAIVLKRELTYIPLFGWFIPKFQMIPVARTAGTAALKNMLVRAESAARDQRQIVIFPEGTRRPPGAPPDYKPGAAAIYGRLSLPCVPFALNSGCYWPRRRFLRYPGVIVVEFLPALPAGLPRKLFAVALKTAIETATAALVAEAQKENKI